MSNNVPGKIKPFGTLPDFGATHSEHYETFLYGHRLEPFGTLRDQGQNTKPKRCPRELSVA